MEIHRLTMEGQAWIMEVHNRPDETDKHDNIALWKEPYLETERTVSWSLKNRIFERRLAAEPPIYVKCV